MLDAPRSGITDRLLRLAEKFRKKAYRDRYVEAHSKQFLARQIRELRGQQSQAEFGDVIGKAQTIVSRLENPYYGKWNLSTLFDVAAKLNRAVIVRIVDFPTFLRLTEDLSDEAAAPLSYDDNDVSAAAWSLTESVKKRERNYSETIGVSISADDSLKNIAQLSSRTLDKNELELINVG